MSFKLGIDNLTIEKVIAILEKKIRLELTKEAIAKISASALHVENIVKKKKVRWLLCLIG